MSEVDDRKAAIRTAAAALEARIDVFERTVWKYSKGSDDYDYGAYDFYVALTEWLSSSALEGEHTEPKEPKCECSVTPESQWFTHYGAVEPGSQMEPNPECPVHFPGGTR